MATAKKAKKAAKKAHAKKATTKNTDKKPAAKKAAPVTKVPKKKAPKKTSEKKQPSLTRTVNMGPLRGDNSFPPGNKPQVFDFSRTPRASAAKDSTRGPGGKAGEGRSKDAKGA